MAARQVPVAPVAVAGATVVVAAQVLHAAQAAPEAATVITEVQYLRAAAAQEVTAAQGAATTNRHLAVETAAA